MKIIHSGGAVGADYAWGKFGKKHGYEVRHYYYKNKTPYGNYEISFPEFQEGLGYAKKAASRLNRVWSSKTFIQFLLSRNWQQVKHSDMVYAIGIINQNNLVEGGTGYAVEMAKMVDKPIYVFDQNKKKWFYWDYNLSEFTPYATEMKLFSNNFAGIGTRDINSYGINAIEKIFLKTY